MNGRHRAIRAVLTAMSPRRAEAYIQSFRLPAEEELFLLECDVRGLSYLQAAEKHSVSPETIKRRRCKAYAKIADELEHNQSRG